MYVVLLAAGMATRLRPVTDACPKCLLPVGGRSILDRALDVLTGAGLREFVIVTGYRAEMIRAAVAKRSDPLRVSWVHNDRYAETNNAFSLLLTEEAVPGPFLLLDSDILFSAGLVQALLGCRDLPCLALDRHLCGSEEIKVVLDADGYVVDLGKSVDPSGAAGESVGVEIFSAAARNELFRTLRQRILAKKSVNEFYEASFKEMIDRGVRFRAVDTTRFPAMEIDSVEDLDRARKSFGAPPGVS